MAYNNQYAYQIVATGSNQEFRAQIGSEPFLIGKGANVDLRLDNPEIQDAHARLLVTSTGQVIFINLGTADSLVLNGEPMASFKPFYWKTGVPAYLGGYELYLEMQDEALEPQQRQALITQNNIPVSSPPQFVIDWGNQNSVLPEDEHSESVDDTASDNAEGFPVVLNGGGTILYSEEEIRDTPAEEPLQTPTAFSKSVTPEVPLSRKTLPQFDDLDFSIDIDSDDDTKRHEVDPIVPPAAPETKPKTLSSTPDQPFSPEIKKIFSPPIINSSNGGFLGGETLPKDWQYFDHLSAQLTINPVNLVAGQRVRVPVSVRNGNDHRVQLRVYVAGLSRGEIIVPEEPISLQAGEIKAFDLIIQPQSPAHGQQEELLIRLRDIAGTDSEAAITLPLQLVFKADPNITGWLNPVTFDGRRHTYLHLQNHTKALAVAFITGHSEAEGIHILPAQTRVEIPAGQIVQIPIRAEVPPQSLLKKHRYNFSLSIRQGSRAPLDYPGRILVASRIRAELVVAMLCLGILLGIGGTYIFRKYNLFGGAPQSPRSLTLTPSNLPLLGGAEAEATQEPIEIESTEELTTTDVAPLAASTATVIATDLVTITATATFTSTPLPTDTVVPSPTLTETPTPAPSETPLPSPTELPFVDPRPVDCRVPVPEGWQPYTIKQGDNAFRLAFDRGISLEELAQVNCLANPQVLHVGNGLLLPTQ